MIEEAKRNLRVASEEEILENILGVKERPL
jgi:hypothetical protein